MARRHPWLAVAGALAFVEVVSAQTPPLAAISGRVTDATGAPVAGVTVIASSPALQGARETATGEGGDFRIPFLPPGDYEIAFRREGFDEARVERSLRATETSQVDVELALAGVVESTTVLAELPTVVGRATATSSTYPARLIELLPVDRSPRSAFLLSPAVASTGPGGNVMVAGAMSYENLYLVDGVSVRDRVFGQPRPFAIEDAIEETSATVAGISAEYGRFTGGVLNVVTRSGGNELTGSLRVTLGNEAWRSLTPYERENLASDPREDSIEPIWEATFGGPVLRDRLWYFLAGRRRESDSAETLAYTDLPYRLRSRESRFEAKLTWSPRASQSFRIAWGELDTREENVLLNPAMDLSSLSSISTPEDLLSLHYTATLGADLFVEAQASRRSRTPTGIGSRTTDRIDGTVLVDASRGGVLWNSPFTCGVCGVPEGELRRADETDEALSVKGSGFFSGPRIGAHTVVVGAELFDELRRSNSFQSGSGFTVTATGARIENGEVFPVFLPGGSTFLEWQPIFHLSVGSRFRTLSAFVNDAWRFGERWTFNLGVRWDGDDGRDQSGTKVSASDAWSPRLAAALDPRGDGVWTLSAGFARYVTSLVFSVGDLGTTHGRPARYQFSYGGPAVNAASGGELVSTDEALQLLFAWFDANGGLSLPLRQAPVIPGLNRRLADDLVPPRADEWSLSAARRFGERGFARLGLLRREYTHQYADLVDRSNGQVVDPGTGRAYDLRLVTNSDRVERTYEAVLAQLDLRPLPALRVAGGYTYAESEGNFDGDDPIRPESDLLAFPEYGEARWRAPVGPLRSDPRHRLSLWASWEPVLPESRGRLAISVLERVESGRAYGAVGQIDSRPYVTNPGYVGPPARVPYFFEPRGGRRTDTLYATDVALHYTMPTSLLRGAELFARLVVRNLFDGSARTGPGDTSVLTAANDPRFQRFDPFREQPVRGVHWDFGPRFGEALSADDFQPPRSFGCAIGLRF